jgi:hypothetical protein
MRLKFLVDKLFCLQELLLVYGFHVKAEAPQRPHILWFPPDFQSKRLRSAELLIQMITLLLYLVIAAIICGVIIWLIAQIPGVAPFANIIRVVVICIFVIYCIYLLINILSGTAGHLPVLKP